MESNGARALDLERVRFLAPSWNSRFYWGSVHSIDVKSIQVTKGEAIPARPVVIEVKKGKIPGDFLWNDLLLTVVSRRVVDLFKEKGFTGYTTYPVDFRDKSGSTLDYLGIAILGRAGRLDADRSQAKRLKRSNGSYSSEIATKGLYFDPHSWDGSDIFIVAEVPGQLLMLERVDKAMKAAGITNYKAHPLSDWRIPLP